MDFSIEQLIEELKRHRPIFPAPGFRAIRGCVVHGKFDHYELTVIGWERVTYDPGDEDTGLRLRVWDIREESSRVLDYYQPDVEIFEPDEPIDLTRLKESTLEHYA